MLRLDGKKSCSYFYLTAPEEDILFLQENRKRKKAFKFSIRNGIQSGKLNFSTFDPQLKGDADSIARGEEGKPVQSIPRENNFYG